MWPVRLQIRSFSPRETLLTNRLLFRFVLWKNNCWTFVHITCVTILNNFKLIFFSLKLSKLLIARNPINVLKSFNPLPKRNTRMISSKISTDLPSQRHVHIVYDKNIFFTQGKVNIFNEAISCIEESCFLIGDNTRN